MKEHANQLSQIKGFNHIAILTFIASQFFLMEKYHIIQNEGFGESRVQYNVSFCTVLLKKFKNIDLK